MEYKRIDDIIDLFWKETNLWQVFLKEYKFTLFKLSLVISLLGWLLFQAHERAYYLIPIAFLIIAMAVICFFFLRWHTDIFGKVPGNIMIEKRFEATVRILALYGISSVEQIQILRELISRRVEYLLLRKKPFRLAKTAGSSIFLCFIGVWLAQEKFDFDAFSYFSTSTAQLMGICIMLCPAVEICEWLIFSEEKRGKYILQSLDDVLGFMLISKKKLVPIS